MTAPPRLTIGVTGLNATDNPGPGVSVLRSLRTSARPGERTSSAAWHVPSIPK